MPESRLLSRPQVLLVVFSIVQWAMRVAGTEAGTKRVPIT
jgi:hypothetical protein